MNQPAAAESVAAKGLLRQLAAVIGNSAEYAVAAALLAVVVVVGGAAWLLTLDDRPKRRTAPVSATADSDRADPVAAAQRAEEQAALAEWNKRLESEAGQPPRPVARPADPEPVRSPAVNRGAASTAATPAPTPAPEPAAPAKARAAAPAPQSALASLPTQARREPVRVAASLDRSSCRPPKYPDSAVRERQEGLVVIGFQLNPSGKVIDSRIEQSSGTRLLDQTALSSLGRCKFNPATVDGVAQTAWVQVRFNWQLAD